MGGAVNAWVHVLSAAHFEIFPPQATVIFERVIWDDANLGTRPTRVTPLAPAYPEATPVPEPIDPGRFA